MFGSLMTRTPLDDWIAGKIGVPPGALVRQAVEDYQLARLRETVGLVKERSSFYRSRLSGVDPGGIASFDAFARLPLTTPEDIAQDPGALVCAPQSEIERIVSLQSSGTTGRPKRIFFTRQDQELTIDFFDHGMRNLVGPGDRVAILLPWEQPGSVGDLLRLALERMGAHPIPWGPVHDAAAAVRAAAEQGATSMVGIPTHVLGMARHRQGPALAGRIRSVLLTTDNVPGSIARAIEGAWGCRVFNHYGMTEMGLGGGVQCQARSALHVRKADLYFEIIDPQSLLALPEGHTGEVVFTTLTRRGMPLVRYRTGDISRFVPGTCPCGSSLRQLDIIRGRVAGRKRLAGEAFSLAELDEAVFEVDGVLDYRCQLLDARGQEALAVDVVGVEGGPDAGDALAREVRQAVGRVPAVARGLAGGRVKVMVKVADASLPVSRGTAKRTIADRRQNAGGWSI